MILNKRYVTLAVWYVLPLLAAAQNNYPPEVQHALQHTGNRAELEKALQYCYKTKDPLKIKSVNFLIANMAIHTSETYYWADANGKRIPYNELQYAGFKEAVEAFNALKKQYGKLHPVPYTYRDIDSISAATLIENIEMSQQAYLKRYGKAPSGDLEKKYLEYILPYRTSSEPLQKWRAVYAGKFSNLFTGKAPAEVQMQNTGGNIKSWFTNTYKIENRKEPLPRLGALQLLSRQKGACEDIADLAAFIARSQGLPAAVDFIPAWATASGIHFLNYLDLSPNARHHFDPADGKVMDTLAREPAKVLRTTYSIQPNTAAYLLHNDTSQIPPNYLRTQNYIDVTHEYWQTSDVQASLFKPAAASPTVAYISVWNFSKWRLVWFGKVSNGKANFTNMCVGAVYLPVFFINGKSIPAGWPVVNMSNGTMVLQPDIKKTRVVHLKEDARYLAFREGKKYRLYYWDNAWRSLGDKVANAKTTELVYDNVPANALLLLVPEYTQKKERPFIVTASGERYWF